MHIRVTGVSMFLMRSSVFATHLMSPKLCSCLRNGYPFTPWQVLPYTLFQTSIFWPKIHFSTLQYISLHTKFEPPMITGLAVHRGQTTVYLIFWTKIGLLTQCVSSSSQSSSVCVWSSHHTGVWLRRLWLSKAASKVVRLPTKTPSYSWYSGTLQSFQE